MSFSTRMLILQWLLGLGLFTVLGGFMLQWFGKGLPLPEGVPLLVIGLGFALVIIVPGPLARAACPSCGERFCGPQDENIEAPGTNLFTRCCKYCGHRPAA